VSTSSPATSARPSRPVLLAAGAALGRG
jgi:hypothetical protein